MKRLALVLLPLLAACGSPTPRRSIRLTLAAEVGVPADVDRVELSFTASRTAAGATCLPVQEGWNLTQPSDLPIVVDFVPGDTYAAWLGLRVVWLKSGTPVDVRETTVPWPSDGVREVEIRLEQRCLGAGCAPDQQCLAGTCSPFESPRPLDPALVEPGAPSCDRDAPSPDGGGPDDGDAGDDACTPGPTCCTDDSHCIIGGQHLACNTRTGVCFTECGPESMDDDARCAAGYHCDANHCFEDIGLGACDEPSDCASGECRGGYCCEHAGLCCAVDADCPDLFDGCATDTSRTCVFSLHFLPDTGQGGTCYNADNEEVRCSTITESMDYYGQDGHYPGSPRSYTDLGDGRVQDNVTGLVWTQSASAAMNWNDARDHCAALALGTGSWRLPRRYELQALLNYGSHDTLGLDSQFSVGSGTTLLWTGTSLAGDESSTAWVVNASDGTVQRLGKISILPAALCVED